MIEELKQRILAKAAILSRYKQRTQQHRINRLFKVDQKKVYTSSIEKQDVVTETYQMLKRVGHFGVEYGVQRKNIIKRLNG